MFDANDVFYYIGTGSAITKELGYIPDVVYITNMSDGDILLQAFPSRKWMAFTSGGTNEIKPGQTIVGATSGARGVVVEVLLASGSWAAGDAAGFIAFDPVSRTGTFSSENIYIYQNDTASVNDAGGAADVYYNAKVDTAAAPITSNQITAYTGSTANTAALGITIGTTMSESGKLFGAHCVRKSR